MPDFCPPARPWLLSWGRRVSMGVDRASERRRLSTVTGRFNSHLRSPRWFLPAPNRQKGPALYSFTFGSPWPFRLHYSQAFVNPLSAKRLETEAWGRKHCGQPSRGEQAAFCITDTEEGLDLLLAPSETRLTYFCHPKEFNFYPGEEEPTESYTRTPTGVHSRAHVKYPPPFKAGSLCAVSAKKAT